MKLSCGKYSQKTLVLFVLTADDVSSCDLKKAFSCCFLGKQYVLILPTKSMP